MCRSWKISEIDFCMNYIFMFGLGQVCDPEKELFIVQSTCVDLQLVMLLCVTVSHLGCRNGCEIVSMSDHCLIYSILYAISMVGWLLLFLAGGGLNGPLRQYFSLYQTVFHREGERKEK